MLAIAGIVAHLQITKKQKVVLTILNSEVKETSQSCGRATSYSANVNQEVLKEFPHVVRGVDLLHFHFCVHIAMIQEVDVGDLHLQG